MIDFIVTVSLLLKIWHIELIWQ